MFPWRVPEKRMGFQVDYAHICKVMNGKQSVNVHKKVNNRTVVIGLHDWALNLLAHESNGDEPLSFFCNLKIMVDNN